MCGPRPLEVALACSFGRISLTFASGRDFDCGADDNYIADMYEGFDMSMSDATNAEE